MRRLSVVAPRRGSVDRNCLLDVDAKPARQSLPAGGAWIEMAGVPETVGVGPSLPAGGAWIEIDDYIKKTHNKQVAPRRGSVDRNKNGWLKFVAEVNVAPRRGSVDRNPTVRWNIRPSPCRSPQGERGSKWIRPDISAGGQVAPRRGAWIEMVICRLGMIAKDVSLPAGERGSK